MTQVHNFFDGAVRTLRKTGVNRVNEHGDSGEGIALLCVEDEDHSRKRLIAALACRYPEMTLLQATNGKEGLAHFSQLCPAIVLTDIRMPVSDGIRMAAGIRAIAPETEIIALTAHADAEHLMAAIETGINRYLLKPVQLERLFETLDGILGRIRDRRRVEAVHRELAHRARDLEQANRELDRFAAAVAHDLRAPLASLTMLAELLLAKQGDSHEQATLFTLHGELVRLNRMVGKLLSFERHAAKGLEPEWTDMSRIAGEIAGTLAAREPTRRVRFVIAPGIRSWADPLLARIVLENLLGNSWKYTCATPDPVIEFGVTRRRQLLFVRDNGQGFDPREAGSIFDHFHRGSPGTTSGYGIGLATVRRIVARHGGILKGVGKPGAGAVFLFTLPGPIEQSPPPASSAARKTLKENQLFSR